MLHIGPRHLRPTDPESLNPQLRPLLHLFLGDLFLDVGGLGYKGLTVEIFSGNAQKVHATPIKRTHPDAPLQGIKIPASRDAGGQYRP